MLNRRESFIAILGLGLVGCGAVDPTPTTLPTRPRSVEWPTGEDPQQRLGFEISALPDSPIKTQLQTRVLRYFTNPKPTTTVLDGTDIAVRGASITFSYAPLGDNARGSFTIQKEATPPTYRTTTDQVVKLPFIIGLRDQDRAAIPASNISEGGMPFQTLTFPANRDIAVGINPAIELVRSTNLDPKRKSEYLQLESFGFIKEACGWLLSEIYLEELVKAIKKPGFQFNLKVIDSEGKPQNVEAATNIMRNAINNGGRTQAIIDLGGYLLALRATEAMDYFSLLLKRPHFKNVVSAATGYDYGTSSSDILYRAASKVLDTPELAELAYAGSITKLP